MIKSGALHKNQKKDLDINLYENLIVELQVFHTWEHRNLFGLVEARGSFISLWNGKTAVCEVPDSKPEFPSNIFFRLSQCCLKNGLKPWDW